MTEQDFDKHISVIEGELKKISSNTHSPLWKSFVSGALSGLGGIFGVAIALAAIGWILNTVGVIPAFRSEVVRLNQALDEIQQNK
jgi:hypothetical protein